MKKIMVLVAILITSSNAFAQEDTSKEDKTVHIKPPKEGGTFTVPAPGPGENLTVIVDRPPAKKVAPVYNVTKKYVTTVQKGSNLHLRGGFTLGYGLSTHFTPSYTAGLGGEIGRSGSPWVIVVASRAGKCEEGVAVDMELAALVKAVSHLRMGVGADMKYCSNVSDHPEEKVDERIVGGSFRVRFEFGNLVVDGSVGIGAVTRPVPGDRKTVLDSYGGLSISLLF